MKKTFVSLLLLATLVLTLFAGCGSGSNNAALTQQNAISIALKDAGLTSSQVSDTHVHVGTYEDTPVYSIHFDYKTVTYEYIIDAFTGQILLVTEGAESH